MCSTAPAHQPVHKLVALRLGAAFLGIQRVVIGGDGFLDRLAGGHPTETESAARAAVTGGGTAFSSPGATAASDWPSRWPPWRRRSPCCRPWRPRGRWPAPACCVVSTPNATGTPRIHRDVRHALGRFARHIIEMRSIAADHRAQADHRVVAMLPRQFARPPAGTSHDPGTLTDVDQCPRWRPVRVSASMRARQQPLA